MSLHFSGGGWIAMSSFGHQTYTRKWANALGDDTLLLSIDYRLAPEYVYPCALDDCWQTYLWTLYFARFYLHVDPQRVVLTGDSAGGNMALGVCMRAMRLGVRLPDALLLSYPAMNLDFSTTFTPSLINSLSDTIAPVTFLRMVIGSYLQHEGVDPTRDPYLSPGVADDSFFARLPERFTIICGSRDTLRDECVKFMNRLVRVRRKQRPDPYPRMLIYNGFSHGFLNYDIKFAGVSQVAQVNQHCADILKEYLNK